MRTAHVKDFIELYNENMPKIIQLLSASKALLLIFLFRINAL